jgi:hypothetical protein
VAGDTLAIDRLQALTRRHRYVLRADIDFGNVPRTTPRVIVELLKRCLDRDVKTRLQVISEARIAIASKAATVSGTIGTNNPTASPSRTPRAARPEAMRPHSVRPHSR